MNMSIYEVDPRRQFVNALNHGHRIGFLPKEGWYCTTCGTLTCHYIKAVRELVPDMGDKP